MSVLLPFKDSASLSLGVELELQLLSLSDHDLTPASTDLLALLNRRPFPGMVTPEIATSMIEIATSIQTDHRGLLAQLREVRDTLLEAGQKLNIGLAGGGTHPFQHWGEQRIFPKPRYQEVSALYGYLAQQFTIFGQHVHVGCRNGDEALYLLHALNRYVPQFIALAASSPYVQGHDTSFDSARLNSVYAFPLSGRAPFLLSWSEFVDGYFEKMTHTGVVKSMKDFYWDIRPKPEYGTIELRVCDTPLDVETAAALACYLQALCHSLLQQRGRQDPVEDDYLVYAYNRFQACRFGLEGTLIDPRNYEPISVREDVLRTLRRVEPDAETLHGEGALEHLHELLLAGNGAQWLRAQFNRSGSVEGVVAAALERFAGDDT